MHEKLQLLFGLSTIEHLLHSRQCAKHLNYLISFKIIMSRDRCSYYTYLQLKKQHREIKYFAKSENQYVMRPDSNQISLTLNPCSTIFLCFCDAHIPQDLGKRREEKYKIKLCQYRKFIIFLWIIFLSQLTWSIMSYLRMKFKDTDLQSQEILARTTPGYGTLASSTRTSISPWESETNVYF